MSVRNAAKQLVIVRCTYVTMVGGRRLRRLVVRTAGGVQAASAARPQHVQQHGQQDQDERPHELVAVGVRAVGDVVRCAGRHCDAHRTETERLVRLVGRDRAGG